MNDRVVVIDYGSGNLRSVEKAVLTSVERAGLRATVHVTSRADEAMLATHIVLPGVGAFTDCMRGLSALDGMLSVLEEHVSRRGKPFLGICVGMQLMADVGLEHGSCDGLSWIGGQVEKLDSAAHGLKVPHMGWNDVSVVGSHPVFSHMNTMPKAHAYFVHSFHYRCRDAADVLATTDYGDVITAAVARDNLVGVQFHPEKSQAVGLKLLENFVQWRP